MSKELPAALLLQPSGLVLDHARVYDQANAHSTSGRLKDVVSLHGGAGSALLYSHNLVQALFLKRY